jgi:hypothetical protein
MLIVCAEAALVEAELVGGLLGCPSCRAVLGPWGHARERVFPRIRQKEGSRRTSATADIGAATTTRYLRSSDGSVSGTHRVELN